MPDVKVICLTNGVFAENCYIVAEESSSKAVLIDPGEESQLFLGRLKTEGLDLQAVWLTHGHIDHVMGVAAVVSETRVPVYLHPADRELYDGIVEQGRWLGVSASPQPVPDFEIAEGDVMKVGDVAFDVRAVPGHSPGSVAFVGDGMVFGGDALFAGSIGRSDLPGGNHDTLIESIKTQLLTLPDETLVFSGHGPETTVGTERESNPFLQSGVSF